jgi:hypothetical protein
MASVSHGLRFVADDYLLLDAHAPCEAISLYNTVSVRPTPDAGEKKVRSMASLFPASLCESLPIKAVIVPRISGGRSRVHRVSAAVALRAWAPSTVFHLPFDDGAVVASMADVVRRVPCFTLDVGDDKARTASAVVQVLEQAAQ